MLSGDRHRSSKTYTRIQGPNEAGNTRGECGAVVSGAAQSRPRILVSMQYAIGDSLGDVFLGVVYILARMGDGDEGHFLRRTAN